MDVGRLAFATRPVMFVWADVDERSGVAVIRAVDDDDVLGSRVRTSQTQCQFVGLAATAHKKANFQFRREPRQQPIGVVDDVVVQPRLCAAFRVADLHTDLTCQCVKYLPR